MYYVQVFKLYIISIVDGAFTCLALVVPPLLVFASTRSIANASCPLVGLCVPHPAHVHAHTALFTGGDGAPCPSS